MINKKWLWAAGSVLVFGLLTGCGTASNSNNNSGGTSEEAPNQNQDVVNYSATLEITEQDNGVNVTYRVVNTSAESQKLSFSNGLKVDYILFDSEGKKLKQYSDEVVSTQALEEVTLKKDEEFTQEFKLEDLTNGQYRLEVFLTAKEDQAKSVEDFVVKNAGTQVTGEYVGQIDPHTVELKVDGKATAYQLSDEAATQLASLKEGGQVSFMYKDNEDGQKVIQEFLLEQ